MGICLVWCATQAAGADCVSPRYRSGKVVLDTQSEFVLNISADLIDFAPSKLICLAKSFRKDFGDRKLSIFIFSRHEAAVNFVVVTPEPTPRQIQWEAQLQRRILF